MALDVKTLQLSPEDLQRAQSLLQQYEVKLWAVLAQEYGFTDIVTWAVPPGMRPEQTSGSLDTVISAYSGMVPRQHQSGEMDRRGRITKRGPALLRKLLVECAWCMIRYNAWARNFYLRLTGGAFGAYMFGIGSSDCIFSAAGLINSNFERQFLRIVTNHKDRPGREIASRDNPVEIDQGSLSLHGFPQTDVVPVIRIRAPVFVAQEPALLKRIVIGS